MRKLGYEVINGVCKGDVVWTLKDKKVVESAGDQTVTKLFTIPEERTIPIVAYKAVNGKLVRQTV